MVRSELDGGDWEIDGGRYKSKRPHLIPLAAAALEIINRQPAFDGSPFVFTLTGRRPLGDFGPFKRELDRISGVTGWRLHDLRRTARSLMSRAGVNSDHAERALGHAIGGIRGVYDRHEYRREKAMAFKKLAALVDRIINPAENVTALRS
jgi:integrase